MRHQSQESQMNCDAMILRRAVSVINRRSKKKGFTFKVLVITLLDMAKEIEKAEGIEYVNDK